MDDHCAEPPDGLELLPHQGCVFIDSLPGCGQQLTHTLTHEKVKLPTQCTWSMEFDEEGFGVLVPCEGSSDVEPLVVEDLLTFVVFKANSGNHLLGKRGPDCQLLSSIWLETFQARFQAVTVQLPLPGSEAAEVSAYLLKWPRPPACRVLFSCKALYEALRLDQFNGQWWRWAWAGLPKWKKHLGTLGLGHHAL
eukprot:7426620-Alexandrium_andersonii.AAC.1